MHSTWGNGKMESCIACHEMALPIMDKRGYGRFITGRLNDGGRRSSIENLAWRLISLVSYRTTTRMALLDVITFFEGTKGSMSCQTLVFLA